MHGDSLHSSQCMGKLEQVAGCDGWKHHMPSSNSSVTELRTQLRAFKEQHKMQAPYRTLAENATGERAFTRCKGAYLFSSASMSWSGEEKERNVRRNTRWNSMSAKEENRDVGSDQRLDNSLHSHGCCRVHTSALCSHTLISVALSKLP